MWMHNLTVNHGASFGCRWSAPYPRHYPCSPSFLGLTIGGSSLEGQLSWLLFSLLFFSLGWLFGSFTVLRWRRFSLCLVTAFGDHGGGFCGHRFRRWGVNLARDMACLSSCPVGLDVFSFLFGHSLSVWYCSGFLLRDSPRLLLFAQESEVNTVLTAWACATPPSISSVDYSYLQRLLS